MTEKQRNKLDHKIVKKRSVRRIFVIFGWDVSFNYKQNPNNERIQNNINFNFVCHFVFVWSDKGNNQFSQP
jgi:hypothetical protein